MGNEKRSFLRVPVRLKALARVVEHKESLPLFSGFGSMGNSDASKLKNSKLQPDLIDFLLDMNSKLDMILSFSSQEKLKEDFPEELNVNDLSGAGIRFSSSSPMREGQYLEIVLVLGQFPLQLAGAVGKVIRCKDCDSDSTWALEFKKINEFDQEKIVQFVFKQQRANIRNEKWN